MTAPTRLRVVAVAALIACASVLGGIAIERYAINPAPDLTVPDIEQGVADALPDTVQRRTGERVRVDSMRCIRASESTADCVASLAGSGSVYDADISVSIAQDESDFFWRITSMAARGAER